MEKIVRSIHFNYVKCLLWMSKEFTEFVIAAHERFHEKYEAPQKTE